MFELKICKFVWLVCFCLLAAGCQRGADPISTEYGKINGFSNGMSVNGTSVFADMFAERGFKVKSRTRISPRINNFQTLVWFPDDKSCPNPEVTQAIDDWLSAGWDRTLIYVGRDYNAYADYLNDVYATAPPEAQEELLRRMAESDLSHDETDDNVWWKEDLDKCEWFERESGPRARTEKVSGKLASGTSSKVSVEMSTMLVPNSATSAEALLKAKRKAIAYSLTTDASEYNDGKIIVVSNGSFLLNYPLVDPDNRILAGNLIDRCDEYGDVLFLESGDSGIKVSDSDTNNTNSWAWIAQAPLRYIVPHFLMWGVLFCFVYFPIFGRPRKAKRQSTTNFRNHINALGKMISRSDLPNRAINKIRKYQETVGESKRKKD